MKIVKKWISAQPVKCDICNHIFSEKDKYFYDFKIPMGPWGIGCKNCFTTYGTRLGIGRGQKYSLKTLEKIY